MGYCKTSYMQSRNMYTYIFISSFHSKGRRMSMYQRSRTKVTFLRICTNEEKNMTRTRARTRITYRQTRDTRQTQFKKITTDILLYYRHNKKEHLWNTLGLDRQITGQYWINVTSIRYRTLMCEMFTKKKEYIDADSRGKWCAHETWFNARKSSLFCGVQLINFEI